MNLQTGLEQILAELPPTLASVSNERGEVLIKAIVEAKRIFIAGAGRSGLAVKSFAMRLMHLGFEVHVVGEVTTPGITQDDLLLIGSGSGATASVLVIAEKARTRGIKVALITTLANSPLAQKADIVLTIPMVTNMKENIASKSVQPLGSLFEQCLLLTLDALVLVLISQMNIDPNSMRIKHANLE